MEQWSFLAEGMKNARVVPFYKKTKLNSMETEDLSTGSRPLLHAVVCVICVSKQ